MSSCIWFVGDPVSISGGGGAVSYWLLAFLLAVNIAGVIHTRRRAATVKSREDKE